MPFAVRLVAFGAALALAKRLERTGPELELDEHSTGKTTCQYVPELGRPDTHDGMLKSTNWHKTVDHYPMTDFMSCKMKCDADANCVAFVRRAEDDVGYLGSATAAIMNAREDPTKLLQVPDDVQLGDCWLLGADKLKKYKLISEITSRRFTGQFAKPFRKLSLDTKGYFSLSHEKVTYEKRDCQCEYRYLGLIRSDSDEDQYATQNGMSKIIEMCEGEYRYIGKEFVEYGVESLYQRTDGQKFIYLCAAAGSDGKKLERNWYCVDSEDPNVISEKAQNASMLSKAGFFFFGSALTKFQSCLGHKIDRPYWAGPTPPGDLAVTRDEDPQPLKYYPRATDYELNDAYDADGKRLPSCGPQCLKQGQGILACAAGKKEVEEVKKDFLLKNSKCLLTVENSRVAWAHWFNQKGGAASTIVTLAAGTLRGAFSGFFWNRDRDYTQIIWRGLALWEKVEKAAALGDYIQTGVSVSGKNMTEGEKYACAEMMVDEVKSAGGIMPKVSQTLAMKPDVVKDDFVRSALKSTQTENPAKDHAFVRAYVARKLQEALDNNPVANERDLVIEDLDEHLELGKTLATGSVAQVLSAKVKSTGDVRDYLCGTGAPPCDVVLKVVFDTNEKNYQDDWEAIQFLGNTLLWTIHKIIANSGFILRMKMTPEQVEMIQHGVSAGVDTWQAVKQGLGAVMDEFDLRIEDLNAKKGLELIKGFDADQALKQKLGIDAVTFDVPKVLMTRSKYVMVQTFAKGDTLTAYHASITGQVDKLKQWRTLIYPSIMGLYGYLMVEKGFFQGDPHPGNWYWEESTKTLTLIDWGLADDLSGGLARAGSLYVNEKGEKPKFKGKEVDQSIVDGLIHEHQCGLAKFYDQMGAYRRKELLCNGLWAKDKGGEEMILVPALGPTMLLEGTDVRFHTKYFGRNLTVQEALTEKFFGTPLFGTGSKKPFILQRRRSTTCVGDQCGHGWELAQMDGEGAKTFRPVANCVSESCVHSSFHANDVPVKKCKEECKDVECIKKCEKFTSNEIPSMIGDSTSPYHFERLAIKLQGAGLDCASLESREEAYKKGAQRLGYATKTMHPVVLALFAALHTNDLLDLKARQENIQLNDPHEAGTKIPDYVAVMLRSLSVFLGMVQDMVSENRPPFVPIMVTEFLFDTSPDEMFTFWHIFAERFLMSAKGQTCTDEDIDATVEEVLSDVSFDEDEDDELPRIW